MFDVTNPCVLELRVPTTLCFAVESEPVVFPLPFPQRPCRLALTAVKSSPTLERVYTRRWRLIGRLATSFGGAGTRWTLSFMGYRTDRGLSQLRLQAHPVRMTSTPGGPHRCFKASFTRQSHRYRTFESWCVVAVFTCLRMKAGQNF